MNRFYFDAGNIYDDSIRIEGKDVNHIKNVLRMRPGEDIVCCDGRCSDYYCVIEEISSDYVLAHIKDKVRSTGELKTRLYLFQALPKLDKMELIIQKAVELGVYEIIPVVTNRCVVKINDKNKQEKKLARWRLIAEAAAKQCGRGIIPGIKEPMAFDEAAEYSRSIEYNIFPYENAQGMEYAKERMNEAVYHESVGIFIGPEGGYEEEEVKKAKDEGFNIISLGDRILRTETAGMTVLSILMFLMSD